MFGISVTAETFNPSNPLTAYVYLAIFAMLIRFGLIIRPLINIYIKFSKQGILKQLWKVKKLSSIKGIEGFLLIELSLLLMPITIAALIRFAFLGQPQPLEWNDSQLYFAIAVGTIWLVADVKRSVDTRIALKPLEKWYANPAMINVGLSSVIWTSSTLEALSKWEFEEPGEVELHSPELKQVIHRSEEGEFEAIDKAALVENVRELGKSAATVIRRTAASAKEGIRSSASHGKAKITSSLQAKVDSLTAIDGRTFQAVIYNILLVFSPLIVIYRFLPSLG